MEFSLSMANLQPDGISIKIYVLTSLFLLLIGFASGIFLRAGALAVLSFICTVAVFLTALILGWTIWQGIAVCLLLLAVLQLGFFTGAAASSLQSTLRKRFDRNGGSRPM